MALGAIEARQIAEINRVLECPALYRQWRSAFGLIQNRVADVAIVPDDFARAAYVLAVVTAEAPLRIVMAYVVGVSLPVNFHLREKVGLKDPLQLGDGRFNRVLFALIYFFVIGAVIIIEG